MKLEEELRLYKESRSIQAREICRKKTIEQSKKVFYAEEQKRILSGTEFLYTQLGYIRKRWWMLQALLLISLWSFLSCTREPFYVQRSMGVAGALFVILLIPELWKNRNCNSMEIEAAAYYSLRQIYAARLLMFGMTDVFLLTVFCLVSSFSLQIAMAELLTQFLFPMVVAACICFGILSGRHGWNELAAIGGCIAWSILWWSIVINERLYQAITMPIWCGLFGMAVIALCLLVKHLLAGSRKIWEENWNGIGNE